MAGVRAVGVDVGTSAVKVAVLDRAGEIVTRVERPLPALRGEGGAAVPDSARTRRYRSGPAPKGTKIWGWGACRSDWTALSPTTPITVRGVSLQR